MITPVLETDRLLLREVRLDDLNAVFDCWMQDENVSKYMWWKASNDINDAKEFIEFELQNLENERWRRWIIVLKKTGGIIGTCLVFFNEDELHWDISYNLGRKYWKKGYVTEAMKKVLTYATEDLHVNEIITTYSAENPASGHVLEKLGFKYEKDVPYKCSGGDLVTAGKCCRFKSR